MEADYVLVHGFPRQASRHRELVVSEVSVLERVLRINTQVRDPSKVIELPVVDPVTTGFACYVMRVMSSL